MTSKVIEDLQIKMVFVGGPRQVGKTTLAKAILGGTAGYLNWDIPSGREAILKRTLPDSNILVFDEIHKYRKWRNYLKGIFDEFHPGKKILVTGSARLDLYRFGGDSLQGRYYYLRLHPLSFAEIGGDSQDDLMQLFELGGFPEPFLSGSKARARRWSTEYRNRLIREEISELENIKDLGSLEMLITALPERVGSPLSINSLREDLSLNFQTVSRWIDILERMYAVFRVLPFGAPRIRAVKKEQKHYHYDWSLIREPGARFENMLASHLLKWIHFQFDTEGRELELRYFRDVDGREVDFVVVENKSPILLVESKLADDSVSPSLKYLAGKFPGVEACQVSLNPKREFVTDLGLKLVSARTFLKSLI